MFNLIDKNHEDSLFHSDGYKNFSSHSDGDEDSPSYSDGDKDSPSHSDGEPINIPKSVLIPNIKINFKLVEIVFDMWSIKRKVPLQGFLGVNMFNTCYTCFIDKTLIVNSIKIIDENTFIFFVEDYLYENITKSTIIMFLEMLDTGTYRYMYHICSSENQHIINSQLINLINRLGGLNNNLLLCNLAKDP